jgi:hypothetical protein
MAYETNRLIPTLSEVRRKEREEILTAKNEEALDMLEATVKFYNKNYPKTNVIEKLDNTWTDPKVKLKMTAVIKIDEYLDSLNENELILIKYMLLYAHDERLIKTPKDHEPMTFIGAKLNKLIPGSSYVNKIIKIKRNKEIIDKELLDLEKRLAIDRKKFNEKFGIKEQFICPYCEKILKSSGGFDYHVVHCKEKPEGE